MSTLESLLDETVKKYGSKRCCVFPEEVKDTIITLTYSQYYECVNDFKSQLLGPDINIQPNQSVSIVLPNGLPFVVSFLATTLARAVAAPLNMAYSVEEFEFYMHDTSSKICIMPRGEEKHPARAVAKKFNIPVWECDIVRGNDSSVVVQLTRNGVAARRASTEVVQGRRPVQEEDVALFLHTSGTTSKPKGVPLSHLNLYTSATNIANTYALSPTDTTLIVMPLFHVHGLMGQLLSTLRSGGCSVVAAKFSASKFWGYATTQGVTWYSAVPTIHQTLLSRAEEDAAPRGTLRFIRSCSASLAPVVLAGLEQRFAAPVVEAYGMTEAAHQMASNPLPTPTAPRKPGTVGTPTNVRICIMDDRGSPLPQGAQGEVCIQGLNVTRGYHNNPDANKANFTSDGWFRTGDQGFLDPDGYLTLTGRLKELINRGGEKISPIELDSVLLKCPGVGEAVAFGVPDSKYGEVVHAAVVGKGVSEEGVIAFCRGALAPFKVPVRVHVAAALPRTDTGKIQRRKVAEHFLALQKQQQQPNSKL